MLDASVAAKARPEAETPPPALWDYADVAQYAGVAERTVRKWVSRGHGPRPVRLGRIVRFRPADVATWIDERAA